MEIERETLQLLEECLGLTACEQDRVIRERLDARPELALRLRTLLGLAARTLPPTEAFSSHGGLDEELPERIGPFRIAGLIGSGGMGVVLRAERDDGLFEQSVAIKLLRSDLESERARAHFDNERRLLARLDHPGVARILDGGEEAGRPYLVMEYVDGRPLLHDLDAQDAGMEARLLAFLEAADAVSAAHRSLVVHGDLKPGNVFRTVDGRVKLLDFGIGRLIDEIGPSAKADQPAYPMTLGYAPPERLAGAPPSVATDVWGLGMLLRELLVGRHADRRCPPSAAAAPEGPVAAGRLAGDLDAIVARATADDPAARYPDAAALGEDVRRHLAGRPVTARPQTWSYIGGRFVRRNRLQVAGAAAALLLVLAAAVTSFLLYLDARAQRAAAEARFEDVRSLAKFQLFSLYPQLAALPGTLEARVRLTARSQAYLDHLAALPTASAAVQIETAASLIKLAEIQGVPSRPNLGQNAQAKANLQRAEAMLAALSDRMADDKGILRELAWARLFLADIAVWRDQRAADGERHLLAAEPLVEQARDDTPEWKRLESFRREVRLDILGWSERYAEGIAFAGETLAWLDGLDAQDHGAPVFTIARAEALNARAEGLFYTDRARASLDDARRADALLAEALARQPGHPALMSARVVSLYNLATTLEPLGEREGLLQMAQELSRLAQRSRALEPHDRLIAWRARNADALLAQVLGMVGRHEEALAVQRRIVQLDRDRLARARGDPRVLRDLGFSTQLLGTLSWEARDRAAACGLWQQADSLFAELEQRGTINAWDRTHVVRPMRHNVRICRGELGPEAYRRPG